MDIVDVRSFQKNAKPILRSGKVLKNTVRSVVGPTLRLKVAENKSANRQEAISKKFLGRKVENQIEENHLFQGSLSTISMAHSLDSSIQQNKISWSTFLQRPKDDSKNNEEEMLIVEQEKVAAPLFTHSTSRTFLNPEDGSNTSRTHSSAAASASRPATSGSALPYHISQSIQQHQATQLEFQDFLFPRQTSSVASVAPSMRTSVQPSSNGRRSPYSSSSSRLRTVVTPMSPELSAAHNLTDLNGRYVPTNAIKDAMLSTVKRHTDQLNREVLYATNTSSMASGQESDSAENLMKMSKKQNEDSIEAPFSQITTNTDDFLQSPLNKDTQALKKTRVEHIENIKSKDIVTKGELAFNDSTRSIPVEFFDINGIDSLQSTKDAKMGASLSDSNFAPGKGRVISTKDIDESPAWKSLLSSTSRAKVASIVRVEDDYSMKWMKMKARRDAQRHKEEARQQNLALQHFFRRVQISSEQNELHQAKTQQQKQQEELCAYRHQEILDKHRTHDNLFHQRKQEREHEKRKEARQMKRTIARSIAEARRLVHDEISEQHAIVLEQKNRIKEAKWQEFAQFSHSQSLSHSSSQILGGDGGNNADDAAEPPWGGSLEELSSFTGHSDPLTQLQEKHGEKTVQSKTVLDGHADDDGRGQDNMFLDDSVSSVVEIPAAMQKRLKEATSLRTYQEVKKEIKDYYDSTMSMRIHRFVHSKNMARRQVEDRERSKVSKTPFHAGMYFSDSITLHSKMDDSFSDHGEFLSPARGRSRSPAIEVSQSRPWTHEQETVRAISLAVNDPAATPLPPYHFDPQVVAESYGLSLISRSQSPPRYSASPSQSKGKRMNPGVGGSLALHPSDSAHLLMRHTPLTPLPPLLAANINLGLAANPSSSTGDYPNYIQLHDAIPRDPSREFTDEEYASYIAAAAAAVASGPNSFANEQILQPRTITDASDMSDNNISSSNPAYSPHPTSVGAKKKSMLLKSFSGLKNSFSTDAIALGGVGGDGMNGAGSDMFQLPGSKRNSVNSVTTGATYASLLRSQSIRKSMSGILPVNATNFDAETEQQYAVLDKFQKKSVSETSSTQPSSNHSSIVRMSIAIPTVATNTTENQVSKANEANEASKSVTFSQNASGQARMVSMISSFSNGNMPGSAGTSKQTLPSPVKESHLEEQDDQSTVRSHHSNSSHTGDVYVASNSSQRSGAQQQVRLVLPPLGISRSNDAVSSSNLNKGLSRPVLLDNDDD
jgi:hypothetical protein